MGPCRPKITGIYMRPSSAKKPLALVFDCGIEVHRFERGSELVKMAQHRLGGDEHDVGLFCARAGLRGVEKRGGGLLVLGQYFSAPAHFLIRAWLHY